MARKRRYGAPPPGSSPVSKYLASVLTPSAPETPNVAAFAFQSELAGIRNKPKERHPVKLKQVWFTRPIHAIKNAPVYIGEGPGWEGMTLSTGPGTVVISYRDSAKGELVLHVPLEQVLAYQLAE